MAGIYRRHSHNPNPNLVALSVTACLHEFTRAAYYGGRVEVFRESFEPGAARFGEREFQGALNYGDVNSMYPWAMLGDIPCELSFVRNGAVDWRKTAEAYLGFIQCAVTIPANWYLPPLPCRMGGKLVFPVGTFSGTWTSEELALVEKCGGHIAKIERSIWFRGRDIFRPYVNHWYKFRDKKAPGYSLALDMCAKLFLNSLYGKFGQSSEREKLWFFPTDEEFDEHELTPISEPSMGAYKETTNSSPPYVIPHIAAWITSRSRARLWSLMWSFLQAGYRIYYCDTDSNITDAPIEYSPALGDLK